MRTLFIGTGEFAIPIWERLSTMEGIQLVGVITQPDKPVGRDQKLSPGPLMSHMLQNRDWDYPVFQPTKLSIDAGEILTSTKPQLIVVAAYGQMVPQEMLVYPEFGCLNVHGSLLPELRGAVPVQMAILQGHKVTGVTIQKMVMELDAGPIVASKETEIAADDTTSTLMLKLAVLGAGLLEEKLPVFLAGEMVLREQNGSQATFCYQADIKKEKAEIKFETPVEIAERMVRAFDPWPIAWFLTGGKRVKVFKAKMANEDMQSVFGTKAGKLGVIRQGKQLFLQLANGYLELLELQVEGKRRGTAVEYTYLATNSQIA